MGFIDSLNAALKRRGIVVSTFCNLSDATEKRILMEYGAIFLADLKVSLPPRHIFPNEQKVTDFQSSVKSSKQSIGGVSVELQEAAMTALLNAVAEAKKKDITIKPRGGSGDASKRSYEKTVKLWKSRVDPGLTYWKAHANANGKKLTEAEAAKVKSLSGLEQVKEIIRLESEGFFFSKDNKKTIFASVAAPGTSQHLFMLAIDIEQYSDGRVRSIMAENGWFQTAFKDQPHFTYLGLKESVLSSLGLEAKIDNSQLFWVPKP